MKYVKILILCVLGLFLLCNLALAWPLTGTLQEWSFEDLRPHDIAFTEDGTAWLVHDVSPVGKVFTFDPSTGTVSAEITASEDAHFWKIARAPDGKMWITDDEKHRLYYFDPNVDPEDITLEKVDLHPDFGPEPRPFGVAVAPDGKVWFTCTGNISIDSEVEDTPSSVGYYDPIREDWKMFLIDETKSCEDGLKDIGTPKDIAVSSTGIVSFTLNSLIKGVRPTGTPGMGQVVDWQTKPTLIICPEAFDLIKLDQPHGVALDPVDPYGIWFIDQGYIPVEDMVGQVIRFRSLTSPDRAFTSIAFPPPPEYFHWDAHFLAVDPSHLYIWATSFNNHALLIIDRPTYRFSSLHFDHIMAPMGIRLFGGEVWFTATGLDPGTAGVGRFTVLPDSDDDGIPDEIDTDPDNYSNGFNDGNIVGEILTRGDQALALIRHIAYDGNVGVIAMADRSGVGGLPASISPYENCPETPDPAIVEVDGNRSALFTCSTPSLKALLGPVEVMLPDGIVVKVPTKAKVSFAEISEGTLNIQNSGKQGTITIEYQGEVTELNVGESTLVETDNDQDGVPNGDDNCPTTPIGEVVNGNGCSIDQLCRCSDPWKNHGKYVSCVANAAESFVEKDQITEAEKDKIVSEAAKSDCGKKKEKLGL